MVRLVASLAAVTAGIIAYSAPVKRDYGTVKADLDNIASQTAALNTNLKNLSDTKPDLQAALNIDVAANALDEVLVSATADAQAAIAAGFPGKADSRAILSAATGFIPVILDTLTLIVTKKATFAKLPIAVAPLIIVDLTTLFTDAQPFEDALISIVPDRLKSIGNVLTSSIDVAFSTALVAYGGTPPPPSHEPIATQGTPTTAPRPPASVATVIADINEIKNQVGILDGAINAFSSTAPTLQDALTVDNPAIDLIDALKAATVDVNSVVSQGPVSDADATTIINNVISFKDQILDALQAIVAKKPAFQSLPVNVISLVLDDLEEIYADTTAFEAALISAAPGAIKASGISIANQFNTALSTAIVAYGGAPPTLPTYPTGSSLPRKRGPNEVRGVPKAAKRVAQPASDSRVFLRSKRNSSKRA